jgi:hypothetical protein
MGTRAREKRAMQPLPLLKMRPLQIRDEMAAKRASVLLASRPIRRE